MNSNIKLIKSGENYCIFNIDNFQLFRILHYTYSVLSHFLEHGDKIATSQKFGIEIEEIDTLLESIGYKLTPKAFVDKVSYNAIDRITLHVSNDCNLRCKYCYAFGGAYGKHRELMSIDTATRFVDYCCENCGTIRNIVFFGGEPFLNFPIIEFVCKRFQDKFKNGEISYMPRFGAITNGTIMSRKIINIIEKYFSFITVSIDGPKDINDINRVTFSGHGSFERIKKFINRISSIPSLKINVEATYTKQHIEEGYSRKMIQDYFFNEFKIKADVVDEMALDNGENAISGLETHLDSPWFDSFLKTIINKRHETKCSILRSTFAVSSTGEIYPCHMNVGDGMHPVLSIWEKNIKLRDIIESDNSYALKNNEICQECWANNICGGCARLSFYDSEKKVYSHTPIKSRCEEFKNILEKTLLKICEVRTNPKLWNTLLARINNNK